MIKRPDCAPWHLKAPYGIETHPITAMTSTLSSGCLACTALHPTLAIQNVQIVVDSPCPDLLTSTTFERALACQADQYGVIALVWLK
jgi:hypothetical protein